MWEALLQSPEDPYPFGRSGPIRTTTPECQRINAAKRDDAWWTMVIVNLASAAAVLGGSCEIFNEVPLPLMQTAPGQISAQVPEDMRPGVNVVRVRSLMNAASSDPIMETVQR